MEEEELTTAALMASNATGGSPHCSKVVETWDGTLGLKFEINTARDQEMWFWHTNSCLNIWWKDLLPILQIQNLGMDHLGQKLRFK